MNEVKRSTRKEVLGSINQIHMDMHADFTQALDELASIPPEFEADRDRVKAEIKVLQKYAKRIFVLYTELSRMKG